MKIFSLIVFVLLATAGYSQKGTYEVVESAGLDVTEYEKAMDAANFTRYHHKSSRRKLKFDTGVVIELYSLDEMMAKGMNIDTYTDVRLSEDYIPPVYHLHSSGIIMEAHTKVQKKSSNK